MTSMSVTRGAAVACGPSILGPSQSLTVEGDRVARPSHQVVLWAPGLGGLESEAGTLPAGLGIPQLLEAVLKLLPLDTYVESPVRAPFPDLRGPTCLWGGGGVGGGAECVLKGSNPDQKSPNQHPTRGAWRHPGTD